MDGGLWRTGAFGYAAVIRHILWATSRRSTKLILDPDLGTVFVFIHGPRSDGIFDKPVVFCEGG